MAYTTHIVMQFRRMSL